MDPVTIVSAILAGLNAIAGVIPQLQGSKTLNEIEGALEVLGKVLPNIQSLVEVAKNPGSVTQADMNAAVSKMDGDLKALGL